MRMFSWRYWVPRGTLLVLAAVFLVMAINPLIRSAIVDNVQAITYSKVDIPRIHTSLRDNQITLAGMTVADPHHPLRNLFEADLVELEVDRDALLKRRVIVKRGRVRGLRLGTERTKSGLLSERQALDYQRNLNDHFHRLGTEWLKQTDDCLQSGLTNEIESVTLAKTLLDPLPANYAQLEQQTSQIQSDVKDLQQQLQKFGDNPLRNLASYQQAIDRLDALGRNIFEVRSHVDRTNEQFKMDVANIQATTEKDLQMLQQLQPLNTMHGGTLSEYLLGPEIAQRTEEILQWVRWSRRFAPSFSGRQLTNSSGTDLVFRGLTPKPPILIESMVLQGQALLGDQLVDLEGAIRNLSSDPKAAGVPTEVVIQTATDTPILVQAFFDATGEFSQDRVIVDCPRTPGPSRVLGDANQLAVSVSSSPVHLWIDVTLDGDILTGEMRLKQEGVTLVPQINPEFCSTDLCSAAGSSLSETDTLDVAVNLSGTLMTPKWTLQSNLGPQLAEGLRDEVHTQWIAKHRRAIEQAHQVVNQKIQEIDSMWTAKQQSILATLQAGSADVELVRQEIATRVEHTHGMVDPKSPLRKTMRR